MYIYGTHAVEEGLTHKPHIFRKVFFAGAKEQKNFQALTSKHGIPTDHFDPRTPPKPVTEHDVHQGVIADIDETKLIQKFDPFIESLEVNAETALVLLGEVQDPQNVGAVIRSAAAFGVAGVLIPEHNQVQITSSVVKVSAGMAFRIPLISIGNVNNTLRELKDKKFWIYGLDGEGENALPQESFDAPAVFVLGGEAAGIREKTKEHCDFLLAIPLHPQCESLNAATSLSVALYEWSRQHPPRNT